MSGVKKMNLSQKQVLFTRMIADLIIFAYGHGYSLTFGEAWRTLEMATWYGSQGKGISSSLHIDRLAVDFNLFKDGKYLTETEDHRLLGEYWKTLGGSWGGDFSKPDGNHYSLEYEGRR